MGARRSLLAVAALLVASIAWAVPTIDMGNGLYLFRDGVQGPVFDTGGSVFNGAAYGVKCDGVSDDTVAIAAAIAAAKPTCAPVLLGPGTCLVSSIACATPEGADNLGDVVATAGVCLKDSCVTLVGAGGLADQSGAGLQAVGTTLKSTTNAPLIRATMASRAGAVAGRWATVANLALVGNQGAGLGQSCLHVDNRGLTVDHVTMRSCGGHGLFLTDSVNSQFTDVFISGVGSMGVEIDSTTTAVVNAQCLGLRNPSGCCSSTPGQGTCTSQGSVNFNRFIGGASTGNIGNGIEVSHGNGNTFVGWDLETNTHGIHLAGTTFNLAGAIAGRFLATYDESNTGRSALIDAGASQNWIDWVRQHSTQAYSDGGALNKFTGDTNADQANPGDFVPRFGFALANGISLVNGQNDNVNISGGGSLVRATGPTGAYSVTGFTTPKAGLLLTVEFAIAQTLTLKNQTGSSAGNQINTDLGFDLVCQPGSRTWVTFLYDTSDSKWHIVATSPNCPLPGVALTNATDARPDTVGLFLDTTVLVRTANVTASSTGDLTSVTLAGAPAAARVFHVHTGGTLAQTSGTQIYQVTFGGSVVCATGSYTAQAGTYVFDAWLTVQTAGATGQVQCDATLWNGTQTLLVDQTTASVNLSGTPILKTNVVISATSSVTEKTAVMRVMN